MRGNFWLENHDGVTTLGLRRRLSLEEVLAVIDAAAKADKCDHRLWKLTDTFVFQAEEVKKIAERGRLAWKPPSRVAYVAANDVSFGLLRMLQVFREQEHYVTMVFREEQEARNWLKGR